MTPKFGWVTDSLVNEACSFDLRLQPDRRCDWRCFGWALQNLSCLPLALGLWIKELAAADFHSSMSLIRKFLSMFLSSHTQCWASYRASPELCLAGEEMGHGYAEIDGKGEWWWAKFRRGPLPFGRCRGGSCGETWRDWPVWEYTNNLNQWSTMSLWFCCFPRSIALLKPFIIQHHPTESNTFWF